MHALTSCFFATLDDLRLRYPLLASDVAAALLDWLVFFLAGDLGRIGGSSGL